VLKESRKRRCNVIYQTGLSDAFLQNAGREEKTVFGAIGINPL